jgi:hypothetical protein
MIIYIIKLLFKNINIKSKMKSIVIYTYYNSEISKYNLNFFVKTELKYRENIDYIIVINGFDYDKSIEFPKIENLTIIKRENKGFDFGGHYSALKYIENLNENYDYYFFMNSGAIGPIIPHYLSEHWTTVFIKKINSKVKLVGTSIVCLHPSDLGGYGPKVEGFFFMTDQIGLNLLKENKKIFCDHEDKLSAIINGEYGLSNCILNNGYSIDCMLRQYQGIDWMDKKNWDLNFYCHPSKVNFCFGHPIIPYEVIFHKWFWNYKENGRLGGTVNFDLIKDYVSEFENILT